MQGQADGAEAQAAQGEQVLGEADVPAEGRAQAISSVYAAIKQQAPDPSLIAILQLDTLAKFAESDNTKLIIPAESSALLGAAQAIKSVMDTVPQAGAS